MNTIRKTTEILGIIVAAIIAIGAISKVSHFPGASFLFTVWILTMLIPLLIIYSINLYLEKKPLMLLLFGVPATLIFLIGFLLLINNRFGGTFITRTGMIILFIILFFVGFRELFVTESKRNFSVINISFIIIGVAIIYVASFRGTSGNLIGCFSNIHSNLNKTNQALSEVNQSILNQISEEKKTYAELERRSDNLIYFIEDIKSEITDRAEKSYSQFADKTSQNDNTEIPAIVLFDDGKAQILKGEIEKYRDFIKLNDYVFHSHELVKNILYTGNFYTDFGKSYSWEESNFKNVPLICAITILTGIETNIQSCELLIINRAVKQDPFEIQQIILQKNPKK
jgi:hypothetical protein